MNRIPNTSPQQSVIPQQSVVIGGGIIGICCALFLQREGHKVTLIDPSLPGESTAKWSCGQMAISEVVPLSKAGILQNIPRWLLEKEGALDLHPQAIPSFIPWFLRFIYSARPKKITEIANALTSLTTVAYDDYETLLRDIDENMIGSSPTIEVFDNKKDVIAEQPYITLRRDLGFKLQSLNADEIADLEPSIAGKFKYGILLDDWRTDKDSKGIITALTDTFIVNGGTRISSKVNELIEIHQKITAVRLENGSSINADNFVVAAGWESQRFFKTLGIKIPLKPIGGYQVLLPTPNVQLNHALMYFNGGFGFIPMDRGLQIGGGIEFASNTTLPNFKRAEYILKKAKHILPELNSDNQEFGIGYRPFLPDTKPVIDLAPRHTNVALAFGHGQLGLTLGATTGRLVADLLIRGRSKTDLSPFRATRF